MKTQKIKKFMSLFLAALMCVITLCGFRTTAYAAEETDEVCLVSFPRDGDANYGDEWGHSSFQFMNGCLRAVHDIPPALLVRMTAMSVTALNPAFRRNRATVSRKRARIFGIIPPSSYNHTISPDDIKLFIGRIFQYGYTGTISTSWRSQNEGGDKLAHAIATQLLVWETVVGERDADFNKVSTGGKGTICDQKSAQVIRCITKL